MDYLKAKKLLKEKEQEQLLEYYDGLNEAERELLLEDIGKISFNFLDYISESEDNKKPLNIGPIPARTLEDIKLNHDEYLAKGVQLIRDNKVAAVLLAGGQGSRLGFDKPKGMFNIGVTKRLSIFEQLMNNIKDVTHLCGAYFHLFIMTSTINNDDTVNFFKQNGYFGYPADKVHFFIQDSEPVCSFDGKIFLSEKHRVAFSPNGNGGWYSSLVNSGMKDILMREGIEWLNVFAVDNVLQRICDPVFAGATVLSGCACGAKVVTKSCPEERVGVLCERNGKPSIVEYYEMPPEIAAQTNADGKLRYPYGVILNYLFRVDILDKIVSAKLPYHLARKAIAHIENGVSVKPAEPNGLKFETLVVDMVELMGSCLAYEVERDREFAPVKNKTGVDSVDSARLLLQKNGVEI